jgi:hypothetical protein
MRRHTCTWRIKKEKRTSWGEKRKKGRDVSVFLEEEEK